MPIIQEVIFFVCAKDSTKAGTSEERWGMVNEDHKTGMQPSKWLQLKISEGV
jgi:hypothetical protein